MLGFHIERRSIAFDHTLACYLEDSVRSVWEAHHHKHSAESLTTMSEASGSKNKALRRQAANTVEGSADRQHIRAHNILKRTRETGNDEGNEPGPGTSRARNEALENTNEAARTEAHYGVVENVTRGAPIVSTKAIALTALEGLGAEPAAYSGTNGGLGAVKMRIANLMDAADIPIVTTSAGGVRGATGSGAMARNRSIMGAGIDGGSINSSTAQGYRDELEEADSAPRWIPGFYKQMQDAALAGGQCSDAKSVAGPVANMRAAEINAQGLGAHVPSNVELNNGLGAATEGKGPQQQTASSDLPATAHSTARQSQDTAPAQGQHGRIGSVTPAALTTTHADPASRLFDSIVRRQAHQDALPRPNKQRASLPAPVVAATASHRVLELAGGAVLPHHGDARLAIAQLGQPATVPRRLPSITAIVPRRVLELGGGGGVRSQHGEVNHGRPQPGHPVSFSRALPAPAAIATRRGIELPASRLLSQHGETSHGGSQISKQSAISRSPTAPAASAIINNVPGSRAPKRDPSIVDYSVPSRHGRVQTEEPASTISATPDGSNGFAGGFIKPGDVLRHPDLHSYDESMEWSGAHPSDFMSPTSPGLDGDDLAVQQPPPKRAKTVRAGNNKLPEHEMPVTQARMRARSVHVSYVGENPNRAYRRKQEQRQREPHLADLADHREMAARILGRDSHWMEGLSASNTSVKQMRGE
ncbi:hypothetical protein LTR27_003952 [Elasticomyces elasticus]|nr:hypothetical protein LTR27_003952 [Elasticomyces elasticus]